MKDLTSARRAACRTLLLLLCVAIVPVTAGAQSLPSGWATADIGKPSLAGSATFSNGVFSVTGAGTDIWNTADQFRFVYRQLSGDGAIVARVDTLQAVHGWTKSGLMLRESLAAGSRHAMIVASPTNGIAFQWRTSTNGTSTHLSGGAGTAPVWLKLERKGSLVTVFRSANGTAWTSVGSRSIAAGATAYVGLALTSHDASKRAASTLSNVALEGAWTTAPLPAGWMAGDVGSPALAGSASHASGVFELKGAGVDIWDTADQFQFVYRQMSGDGDIVARVASLQGAHDWTKAGLMIRESLAAGSRHAVVAATPKKGIAFQWRTSTSGISTHLDGGAGTAPVWLKLERRGNVLSAYRSSTGTAWTFLGSQTLSLPSSVYVGLALASHDTGALAIARFEGVTQQAAAAPVNQPPVVSLTSPANGATYLAPASVTLTASASDSDGSVVRVDFYAGTTLIGTSTASPFAVTWNNAPAGTHVLVAAARDNSGSTTVSGARTVYVQDAQAPGVAVFAPSSNHATAVSSYLVEIFAAGSNPSTSNAMASQDIGKPAVVSGEIRADISKTVGALGPGNYVAVVTARGPDGTAASAPSPVFTR